MVPRNTRHSDKSPNHESRPFDQKALCNSSAGQNPSLEMSSIESSGGTLDAFSEQYPHGFEYDFDGEWYTSTGSVAVGPVTDNSSTDSTSDMPVVTGRRPAWRCVLEECYQALRPEGQVLSVTDICNWIRAKYKLPPKDQGWRGSVRYNLSKNEAFEKMGNGLWRIRDDAYHHGVDATSQTLETQGRGSANGQSSNRRKLRSYTKAAGPNDDKISAKSRESDSNFAANRFLDDGTGSSQSPLATPRSLSRSFGHQNLRRYQPLPFPRTRNMLSPSSLGRFGTPALSSSAGPSGRTVSPYLFQSFSPSPLANQYIPQQTYDRESTFSSDLSGHNSFGGLGGVKDATFACPYADYQIGPRLAYYSAPYFQGILDPPIHSFSSVPSVSRDNSSRAYTNDSDSLYDDEPEEEGESEDDYRPAPTATRGTIRSDAYSALLWRCLEELGAPVAPVALQTIYAWFLRNTNKCDGSRSPTGMERSIRHNLSQNEAFVRSGSAGQWTFAPGFYEAGMNCLQPTTHFRRNAAEPRRPRRPRRTSGSRHAPSARVSPSSRVLPSARSAPKRRHVDADDDEEDSVSQRPVSKKARVTKRQPPRAAKSQANITTSDMDLSTNGSFQDSDMNESLALSSYQSSPYPPTNLWAMPHEQPFEQGHQVDYPQHPQSQGLLSNLMNPGDGYFDFMQPMPSVEDRYDFTYDTSDPALYDAGMTNDATAPLGSASIDPKLLECSTIADEVEGQDLKM